MKTNVKISRKMPAAAFITPADFSLNYYHNGKELTVESSVQSAGFNDTIESKITVVLNQVDSSPCALVIILSADLTLYSEQVFPRDLSDVQIDELVMLQLLKRTDSGELNTFYDYFLLTKTQASSTYGLIEARKDVLQRWVNIFKKHGFNSVAIVSQPIVLINYILKNSDINVDRFKIICLLPTRIVIAHIRDYHVEKITEHVIPGDLPTANSLVSRIVNLIDEDDPGSNPPIILLDTVECSISNGLAENFRIFPGFHKEQVLGENTIKWLRAEYDIYKSVALA